jgi:hypothetical protein
MNETTLIPEADHRVVVNKVTLKTYRSGNDGFEIMLDVSGYPNKLWHRIILDPTDPEKTNHHLGKFFESFGITDYDLNHFESWVGKDGAVRVKHDTYDGSTSAKVLFCITRAYQGKLPPWGQPSGSPKSKTGSAPFGNTFFDDVSSVAKEQDPPAAKIPERKFAGFSF